MSAVSNDDFHEMQWGRFAPVASDAIYDDRLTHLDVRVLGALGTYMNRKGWCFPSRQTLADRLKVNTSSISTSINRLALYGYVEVRARIAKGARGKLGNEYRVRLDMPDGRLEPKKTPTRARKLPQSNIQKRSKAAAEVAPRQPRASEPMLPQNNIDPAQSSMLLQGNFPIGITNPEEPTQTPSARAKPKADTLADLEARMGPPPGDVPPTKGVARKIPGLEAPRTAPPSKPNDPIAEGFAQLWAIWLPFGRKNSRRALALEAYIRAISAGETRAAILAGAKGILADSDATREQGRYLRSLDKFIDGKDFLDWEAPVSAVAPAQHARYVKAWDKGAVWQMAWGPRPDRKPQFQIDAEELESALAAANANASAKAQHALSA